MEWTLMSWLEVMLEVEVTFFSTSDTKLISSSSLHFREKIYDIPSFLVLYVLYSKHDFDFITGEYTVQSVS